MRLRERLAGENPLSADLIEWEMAQADPHSDVWLAAVMGADWALYPPGGYDTASGTNDPWYRVSPADVRFNEADKWWPPRFSRRWLLRWTEQVAQVRVLESVEGYAWYGSQYRQSRPVVYMRVAAKQG